MNYRKAFDTLVEVRNEIANINRNAGEVVFNPAATTALESLAEEVRHLMISEEMDAEDAQRKKADAPMGNPYMTLQEAQDWQNDTITRIGDYTIKPKKDFGQHGWWDAPTRSNIRMGWIITKVGEGLATPGAGWYYTRKEAEQGVGLLMASKGDADVYHGLTRAMKCAIQVSRDREAVLTGNFDY